MLRRDESIFDYSNRCKQASEQVQLRFTDWIKQMRRTTEDGRNNARRRIALEVYKEHQ